MRKDILYLHSTIGTDEFPVLLGLNYHGYNTTQLTSQAEINKNKKYASDRSEDKPTRREGKKTRPSLSTEVREIAMGSF